MIMWVNKYTIGKMNVYYRYLPLSSSQKIIINPVTEQSKISNYAYLVSSISVSNITIE